jgi:hypothetical protein
MDTVARNPQGPGMPFDPDEPTEKKRVQKGGSFLCTDQYCTRYMVGTRGKSEVNSATNHIGFRCAMGISRTRRGAGRPVYELNLKIDTSGFVLRDGISMAHKNQYRRTD